MKKFYISIFTTVLLFAGVLSHAQIYNSISDGNPNGYTLDDPRFWVGPQPGNPCTNCTIRISSPVKMVPCCGFSTSVNPYASSVFTSQVPSGALGTGLPLTLGLRFQSSVVGSINGAKFFKVPGMGGDGNHIALLYDNLGNLLDSTSFVNETASGWQTQNFRIPFTAVPNTTYVIAVFFADGNYTADAGQTGASIVNGVLTALADGLDGTNGAFAYGAVPAFPTGNNTLSTNFWVDLNFSGVDGIWLNEVTVDGTSTINLYGTTDFAVNTYLRLFGTSLTIGNDPTSPESISLNGQIELNGSSYVQLANNLTFINANRDFTLPVIGPYSQIGGAPTDKVPGIYSVNGAAPGGYTAVLQQDGLGASNFQYLPPPDRLNFYDLNCEPTVAGSPNTCTDGFVFGPVKTDPAPAPDAAAGIVFLGSATLPVQLVKFTASQKNDGTVLVSWSTSQEQNSAYFDVERSTDQTNWVKIGTVKAKGYSSTTSDYNLTDKFPLDGNGYYHLKMVDLDGKYKYSKPVSVSNGQDNRPLVIYSNPFSDQIRLKVNVARAQNLTLTVSDMLGKTYVTQSYNAKQGDNEISLFPRAVGSGMYILRIHGDSYEQTVKLEKQ